MLTHPNPKGSTSFFEKRHPHTKTPGYGPGINMHCRIDYMARGLDAARNTGMFTLYGWCYFFL